MPLGHHSASETLSLPQTSAETATCNIYLSWGQRTQDNLWAKAMNNWAVQGPWSRGPGLGSVILCSHKHCPGVTQQAPLRYRPTWGLVFKTPRSQSRGWASSPCKLPCVRSLHNRSSDTESERKGGRANMGKKAAMKGKLGDTEKGKEYGRKRQNTLWIKRNPVTVCCPIEDESLSTSWTAAPKNNFLETHKLWSPWKEFHPMEQESQGKFLDMLGHFSCGAPSKSSKQAEQHSNVETSLQQSQSRKQLSYHWHTQNPCSDKGGKKRRKKGRHTLFSQRELHYWELQLLLYKWCKHFCFLLPTNTGGKAQSSSLNKPQVHGVVYTLHLCVQKSSQQPSQAVSSLYLDLQARSS